MKTFWRSLIYAVVCSVIVTIVGLFLPRDGIDYGKAPYKPYKWEIGTTLYTKLRVAKWKDKVPDVSRVFRRMITKKIEKVQHITPEYVRRLIAETCIAEISHLALAVLCIGVLFIWRSKGGLIFYVLYGIVGNIPFILIQRYNRPRFVKLLSKMENKNENFDTNM